MADKKKIFIVDDQQLQLDLTQGILEIKFEVKCFLDGKSFLTQFEKTPADVVLLDVNMPEMDGLEVCRRLLIIEPQCPVMFISALDSPEERMAGYDAGGYDYIVKPFQPDELLPKLKNIIKQQEQQLQLAKQHQEFNQAFHDVMKGSSELGIILHFAVKVFEIDNFEYLAEAIAATLEELGEFKASFFVGGGQQEEYFWSHRGPCPPMDVEVLAMLKEKGRIYEFENKMQMNEKFISLLIKNMPEDEMTKGRYRDNLHFLLKIASASAQNIDTVQKLETNNRLLETIQGVKKQIIAAEQKLKGSITDFLHIVENEFERIENELQSLALSEEQENKLISSLKSALALGLQSADETHAVCSSFEDIISELNSLL